MPSPSVTYTFIAGTTIDPTEVNTNYTDIINSLTDGTKDLSVSTLTLTSSLTANGSVIIGNNAADTVTFNAQTSGDIVPAVNNTDDIGSSAKRYAVGYLTSLDTSGAASIGTNLTVNGTGTIGDGTGTGTDPDFTINNDTGDARIRLQVNNDISDSWDIAVDNSDSDNLIISQNGTKQLEITKAGSLVVDAGSSEPLKIIGSNVSSSTTPDANTLFTNTCIKAWASTSSSGSLQDGVNLTVSKGGTGLYTYTFRTPMSNTNYSLTGSVAVVGAVVTWGFVYFDSKTTTGFRAIVRQSTNGSIDEDHSVMVIGEQ